MPHVLDDLALLDPDGRLVRVGDLWSDRMAVLMFVRHFGCLFCKQQVAEIAPFLGRIRAAGAELFVIGQGSVEEAREFRDEHRLEMRLLTYPTRQAYCALGMRRGAASALKPAVVLRGLEAMRQGFRQTRTKGDPLQQGGVLVIAPGGEERYRYISQFAGDHPAPAGILDHCRRRT